MCSIRERILTIENRSTARKHIPVSGFIQNIYVSPVSIKFVGKREIKATLFARFYNDNNVRVKRHFLFFYTISSIFFTLGKMAHKFSDGTAEILLSSRLTGRCNFCEWLRFVEHVP